MSSGTATTQIIRAFDAPAGCVPIVAMTAHGLQEQATEIRATRVDDYVGKPFDYAHLHAVIGRCSPGREFASGCGIGEQGASTVASDGALIAVIKPGQRYQACEN